MSERPRRAAAIDVAAAELEHARNDPAEVARAGQRAAPQATVGERRGEHLLVPHDRDHAHVLGDRGLDLGVSCGTSGESGTVCHLDCHVTTEGRPKVVKATSLSTTTT